jgi:hypothetical protein
MLGYVPIDPYGHGTFWLQIQSGLSNAARTPASRMSQQKEVALPVISRERSARRQAPSAVSPASRSPAAVGSGIGP